MKHIRSLCVFCGSRTGGDAAFAHAAGSLGRILAERGVRLVYGGGSIGLMGVVMGSVLEHGGEVTGVIPDVEVPLGDWGLRQVPDIQLQTALDILLGN